MAAPTIEEVEVSVPSTRTTTGSPAERFTSFDPDAFPEPRGRDEEWRFAPFTRLRPLLAGPASDHCLTWETHWPEGVSYSEVGLDDPRVAGAPASPDKLGALAHARSGGAAVVSVAANATPAEPVRITLSGDDPESVVWGRVVVDVGHHAEVTIVVDHRGKANYAAATSILVGDGAQVTYVQVDDWDAGTVHSEHVGTRVGRDASFRHIGVTLGGEIVRVVPTVEFAGPGAKAELLGVGFAGNSEHFETRLFVDHNVDRCTSNVLYKNALLGETARTVWIGDVRIRPAAVGTSTFELNRNLLLSDGARADSVPNLEIETGEIAGAGHASATGRFDDLQLFYLQSRGIPEKEARFLVVRGFFADVIRRIGLPDLEDRLMASIDERLTENLELIVSDN